MDAYGYLTSIQFAPNDTGNIKIEEGDRVLLCSDGIYGWLDDAEIGSTLRDAPDPYHGATLLVQRAMSAFSQDNLTALVLFADRDQRDNGRTLIPV